MTAFQWAVSGRYAVGSASFSGISTGFATLSWGDYPDDPSGYPWPDPLTWPPARVLGVGFTLAANTGLTGRRPVLRMTSPELGMFEHRALGTTPGPSSVRRYEFWPGYERNSTAASVAMYREPWPHDAVLFPSVPGTGAFLGLSVEDFVLGQDSVTVFVVSLELLLP